MNNEPVAWVEYIQGEEWEVWFVEPTDLPKGHTYKPLYTHPASLVDWSYQQGYQVGKETHPAKTPTDGIDLLEKYADKLEDERPNKGFSDVVYESIEILRKAQEK